MRLRVLAVMKAVSAEVPLLRYAEFIPMTVGDRGMGYFRITMLAFSAASPSPQPSPQGEGANGATMNLQPELWED